MCTAQGQVHVEGLTSPGKACLCTIWLQPDDDWLSEFPDQAKSPEACSHAERPPGRQLRGAVEGLLVEASACLSHAGLGTESLVCLNLYYSAALQEQGHCIAQACQDFEESRELWEGGMALVPVLAVGHGPDMQAMLLVELYAYKRT